LQVTPRGLLFRDLNSTNGILVNGIPAAEGFLNPGDQLNFGTYVLDVCCRKTEA
jgi:pSer/pThr/pTyr-binding forkhead associated (FHA) protein